MEVWQHWTRVIPLRAFGWLFTLATIESNSGSTDNRHFQTNLTTILAAKLRVKCRYTEILENNDMQLTIFIF